eukprot:252392_1
MATTRILFVVIILFVNVFAPDPIQPKITTKTLEKKKKLVLEYVNAKDKLINRRLDEIGECSVVVYNHGGTQYKYNQNARQFYNGASNTFVSNKDMNKGFKKNYVAGNVIYIDGHYVKNPKTKPQKVREPILNPVDENQFHAAGTKQGNINGNGYDYSLYIFIGFIFSLFCLSAICCLIAILCGLGGYFIGYASKDRNAIKCQYEEV